MQQVSNKKYKSCKKCKYSVISEFKVAEYAKDSVLLSLLCATICKKCKNDFNPHLVH